MFHHSLLSGLLASAGLSAAVISGSVYDANGVPMPAAHVTLLNPDTAFQQETVTGPDGRFDFSSLDAGSYLLHFEKTGVGSQFRVFTVAANSDVQRGFLLNSTDGVVPGSSNQGRPVRVQGMVAEGNLVHKVQPLYPTSAKQAHVQGTVTLEATISRTGIPEDLRVVFSPNDDLTQASLEAVRQWRYRPTLPHGQPEPIITDVIVNYTLRP